MELLLTGNLDQALLAFVITEARKVANQLGGVVGRTAVQKIMYFLKNAGVPMRYRFSIYHYGPFCDEILSDTELLMADSVIADRAQTAKYSDYIPGEALNELISCHQQTIEPWRETIANVVRGLAPFKPEIMEATATLDYIYRQLSATRDGKPTKERVVEKFLNLKGEKFQRQDIERLYDVMLTSGALQ